MIADVLNEIKRILETHLPDELAKQDGHAGDGVVCDPFRSIQFDETQPNNGFPAIVIRPEEMVPTHWATGVKDVDYTISIGIVTTDTVEENSLKKLWRSLRAVENALEAWATSGGVIMNIKTTGINYQAGLFSVQGGAGVEKAGILQVVATERLRSYSKIQV